MSDRSHARTDSTRWALYGGAGFIGQHLACSILAAGSEDRVTLLDIRTPDEAGWKAPLRDYGADDRLRFVRADVRRYEQLESAAEPFDVIVNLAAIHREPGHRPEEYFETNLSGARNVCRLAESVACREILFTSSIAVYGVHDRSVDEYSPPEPRSAYGQSKLQAEDIHRAWADRSGGNLIIVRPGVVFGPGEQGNVTRLVKESLRRKRPIAVRPDQAKAGIYVDELISVMHWLRNCPELANGPVLVNGVSSKIQTFNAIGEALLEHGAVSGASLTVPRPLLQSAIWLLSPLRLMVPAASRFHPQRLAKLLIANDIRATVLEEMGYPFEWPLQRAMADWLSKGL
jgi:nucleoside-diphosphate-sugar epimerase